MIRTSRGWLALVCAALAAACGGSTGLRDTGGAPIELELRIPSGETLLPATLYAAGGAGPHPTLVWFHGFPGLAEPSAESIDILRGAGFNVLYPHYRGTWGAPGTFSPAHALEDAAAVFQFLRTSENASATRIVEGSIIPVGDSFGSWVALKTAAADLRIPCVAGSLVLNLGFLGESFAENGELRDGFLQMFTQIEQDPQLKYRFSGGAGGLMEEIIRERAGYELVRIAPALRNRPLLLIGAESDELAPVTMHLDPVHDAVGGNALTRAILPGGHELADSEYAGMLADWARKNCP